MVGEDAGSKPDSVCRFYSQNDGQKSEVFEEKTAHSLDGDMTALHTALMAIREHSS